MGDLPPTRVAPTRARCLTAMGRMQKLAAIRGRPPLVARPRSGLRARLRDGVGRHPSESNRRPVRTAYGISQEKVYRSSEGWDYGGVTRLEYPRGGSGMIGSA